MAFLFCANPPEILLNRDFSILGFETYLKTKIEKLSQIETKNLDCKSPDYHEHFSTKSFDESKASVYFTPTDGHLSPQPLQVSPIHINYINDGINGCEAAGYSDWRAQSIRNVPKNHQRNSFILPCDYLDEDDELGNFIIPDPVYNDDEFKFSMDRFQDVIDTPTTSMMSINSNEQSTRRRRKRYRDHRRSRHSIENETLLMQDMVQDTDVSKGARPKVYYNRKRDVVGDVADDAAPSASDLANVKKVNSQVNIDEKTGKVISSSTTTSTDCDLATNINVSDKMMTEKMIKLQSSSSLPDLQSSSVSSTGTNSSNSNNQLQGHGKHVILTVEAGEDSAMNQMNGVADGEHHNNVKMKMNFNIDPSSSASNGSSSSASSNNLEYGIVSNTSTL